MTIEALYNIILTRKNLSDEDSYVSFLFKKGKGHIVRKVNEEAFETVEASLMENKNRITEETADLWFHSLVLLAMHGITPDDIMQELQKRHENR